MPKKKGTGSLPGMEREEIEEIESLADELLEKRIRRMALLRDEVETQDRLVKLMLKHNMRRYKSQEPGGIQVALKEPEGKIKAKVSRGGDAADEE